MEIGYNMGKENWKELLETLKNTNGMTLSYYPEVDENGLFVDFKYILFEHDGNFFYVQEDLFDGFTITAYQKVSPYEKHQASYPKTVRSFDEIVYFVDKYKQTKPLKDTYKQRIYLTELYCIKDDKTNLWRLQYELAGNREKDILNNLDKIEMIRNSGGYKVLRFRHKDGEHTFDYECNSKKICG